MLDVFRTYLLSYTEMFLRFLKCEERFILARKILIV